MNQTPQQLIHCKRWYCKNTLSAYAALHTGGYCDRCDKARKTLGGFFTVQPFVRVLSFPFLFVGGCGLGVQFAQFLSNGPAKEDFYDHPGAWFLGLALAGALFGFGWLLRWIAEIDSFSHPTSASPDAQKAASADPDQLELRFDEAVKPESNPDKSPASRSDLPIKERVTPSNRIWRDGRFVNVADIHDAPSGVFCPDCGKEVEAAATFCPFCGRQLDKD